MQERTSSNLVTGQRSRQKIQEILLHTGDKVGPILENWRIFWIFPKFLLWGLHSHFFWSQSGEFSAKKKHTHTAMNALSQLGTQVSKVYRQTLLSYYLDSNCAPRFRFSRIYFWELNGLSFMGIRSRKNGDRPQEDLAQSGYGPAMTCTIN